MPGIVQYPYYTVKGPDCFFYDSDGNVAGSWSTTRSALELP